MASNFVHLRLHTSYSLAESTLRIRDLASQIVADAQPAAAITDTNNMFGSLEFSETLIERGVQPGEQLTICDDVGSGEVVLLAKTQNGYSNLLKLLSKAILDTGDAGNIGISGG